MRAVSFRRCAASLEGAAAVERPVASALRALREEGKEQDVRSSWNSDWLPKLKTASTSDFVQALTELRRGGLAKDLWQPLRPEVQRRLPDLAAKQVAQASFAVALGQGQRGQNDDDLWLNVAKRIGEMKDVNITDLAALANCLSQARVKGVETQLLQQAASLLKSTDGSLGDGSPPPALSDASSLAFALAQASGSMTPDLRSALWDSFAQFSSKALRARAALDPDAESPSAAGEESSNSEKLLRFDAMNISKLCASFAERSALSASAHSEVVHAIGSALLANGKQLLVTLDNRGLARCLRLLSASRCALDEASLQLLMAASAEAGRRGPSVRAGDASMMLQALASYPIVEALEETTSWPPQEEQRHGLDDGDEIFRREARGRGAAILEMLSADPACSLTIPTLGDCLEAGLLDGSASPRDAANGLHALSRLEYRHEGVFEAMSEYVPLSIGKFGLRDVVGLVVAYGRLKERDEPTLLALATCAQQQMAKHSISDLTSMATAFARLKVRDLPFLEDLLGRLSAENDPSMASPHEAVALLSAFGRLQVAESGAFSTLGQTLLSYGAFPNLQTPQPLGYTPSTSSSSGAASASRAEKTPLQPSDLAEVASAFARASSGHEPLLETIAASCAGLDSSHAEVPVAVLFAMSWLRWQHPALQQHVLTLQRSLSPAIPMEQETRLLLWSRVLHAATDLDTYNLSADARSSLISANIAVSQLLEEMRLAGWNLNPGSHSSGDDLEEQGGFSALAGRSGLSVSRLEMLFASLTSAALQLASANAQSSKVQSECEPDMDFQAILALMARSLAFLADQATREKVPNGILLNALLLQACGMLEHPAFEALLPPMQEVAAFYDEWKWRPEAQEGFDASADILSKHEPGLKGRELTKEALAVSTTLSKILGPDAARPLAQPWIVKRAGLGVNLVCEPLSPEILDTFSSDFSDARD